MMMEHKTPILLAFYSLSNKENALVFGQLTYTRLKDFSFRDFSRRKTFRTLVNLYRTTPYAHQYIVLVFDKGKIHCKTDAYGAFYLKTKTPLSQATLQKVLLVSGEEVKLMEDLYPYRVQSVPSDLIVVSDIDDTIIHSFIYRRLRQIRTLMFTTVEKRKTVTNMLELLRKFEASGATCFYLSNSEQNLYPLIYRFLTHNAFPSGPLFLKKMRGLWDVISNFKFPLRNVHKQQTIEDILSLFPDKQFVLMGDNTQHDLTIYLEAAVRFPRNIRYIVIRKVLESDRDMLLMEKHRDFLAANNITLYYADHFPYKFIWQH
jgi:phosphatidate phosphatase APP1